MGISVLAIRELIFAAWVQNGAFLTFEDIVDVAHRYSREVEHSDVNLLRMEKLAAKEEMFSVEKLTAMLLYKV